jgi:hypothetical protein
MRILFDGREVESLPPKVARKAIELEGGDSAEVEGVVLAGDKIVADAARRSRIGLSVLCGFFAVILIGVAIGVMSYEPGDMVVIGPLYLVILLGMAWGGPAMYRRSTTRLQAQITTKLARLPPAETIVRLDAAGLTVGERMTPWSAIAVDTVEVVTLSNPDSDDSYTVDAVVLDAAGQPAVLDRGVMRGGSRLIGKALRTLGVNLG